MNFKKIELIGFKSFADRQEIQFENGVTCIVGPNGCGKSNVADAIRWVLGEQSAKSLRGTSMQDVIFNGTQNRKSLSYCEVSLTFDNTNKIFKEIDYTEVVFTRKLYRSGESEYFINKKPARRGDIIDLLHECGVSKEGYTIIGQGKVAEILNSKPEDRRSIFEEAVGIAKTKAKRLETERKLDRTRDNVTRIVDITTELERQLEPLEKQAEKARAHRALSEELKYHEVNAYLYKYDNAAAIKSGISARMQSYADEAEVKSIALQEAIRSYNDHLGEISSADEYIRQLNEELRERAVAAERQSGTARVYGEKINTLRAEIRRLEKEIENAKAEGNKISDKIAGKKAHTEAVLAEIAEKEKRAAELNAELAEVAAAIAEGNRMAQSAQQAVLHSVESLADLKQNIGALSSEKNVISAQQQETVERVQALNDKLDGLVRDNAVNNVELQKLEKSAQKAKDDIRDMESDVASTQSFIADITTKIYSINSEIAALEANGRVYANLKDNYDGYQFAVKKLMQATKESRDVASRVKGVVANIIKTDAKYDVAIETCLGGAVQNVVTASQDDAKYLIQFLKRTESGRVTFLPVESMKPRYETSETKSALRERGALGLANELVSYDKYYDKVVRFLLGNTLIVDNIDNAVSIARKYQNAFKIVTLDGDLLASSGSMTGGSRKQNTSNLLAMDRRVAEIEEQLKARKNELSRLSSKKAQLEKQIAGQREELERLNTFLQDVRQQTVAMREKIAATEGKIADTTKEIEGYRDSIALINTRLTEINKEYSSIELGNEELDRKRRDASFDAEKHQTVFAEYTKRRDDLIDENTGLQASLSYLRSQIKADEEEVARMEERSNELLKQIEENKQSVTRNNNALGNLLADVEKVALSDSEKEYLNSLREKIAAFEQRKKTLNEQVQQDNMLRGNLQAEITKLNEKKYGEEVALSKVDTELEYMRQKVWEDYQITYENAASLKDGNYDITVSNQEINRIRKKIASLGAINPNAIDDFNVLNDRYQEMAGQRDDLLKAEQDLKAVIAQLTDEMSTTFAKGFAAIRANFTRIFKELFGGGTADLILEKGFTEDPLEQGIEIVAEPPGKKLQKISLLSGGEMALTAIAILFAILKLRPMPFVVLDEIEAALDDANVERFAQYLKHFSDDTQFIVITHKKVTMERADALFGVTMQEKGVSKIVSVKIADAVESIGA